MTEVLGLRRGGQAARERQAAEKEAREKARSNSFRTWEYCRLAAPADGQLYGESIVVRVVTDEPDWVETLQHNYMKTKPAPLDKPKEKGWPTHMDGVCRYTIVPKKEGDKIVETPWYKDCFICDRVTVEGKKGPRKASPSPRFWAWAVEREEVLGTQEMLDKGEIEEHEIGTPVSYRDKLVEHTDESGETTLGQRWLLLNFATENFFDALLGYNNVYHTVVDRDYKITRKGSGTDTSYGIVAMDVTYDQVDGKRVKYDLRRPQVAEKYQPPVEIFKIVAEKASDEWYDWWFNTDVESSWEAKYGKKEEKSGDSDQTNSTTAAEEEEAAKRLEAMRARLKSESRS
jgi:hypothetical protein